MAGPGADITGLESELERKEAEVGILRRVASEINATLELEVLFDTVLRTMDELFGFEHAMILLLEDSRETLRVAASRGYDPSPEGARVGLGSGLVGVVAKRRRMTQLKNLGQQRAYASTVREEMEKVGRASELEEAPALPGLSNVESQIGIPLLVKEELIGVFFVESETKRSFSDHEEGLIAIVASHAASAIGNAKLLSELAQARERLEKLNETLEERVRERTEELSNAYRELRETQGRLLQTAKLAALGDLVAGVTHEINTPLGSIYANADLARRAGVLIAETFEREPELLDRHPKLSRALSSLGSATAMLRSASERIKDIVSSLKSFARLDEAERKRANLHEGIDSALTLLRHRFRDDIEVVKSYDELPEVLCYPNRINQVFMNLLLNAVQAMPTGGVLTVATRRSEDFAVIEITDTGIGIPTDKLERVFDPGFTTKDGRVGAGLGLAISYRIVEEHGGSITVSSREGEGTVVTLRLPLSQDP